MHDIENRVLVIGAGIAGINAALRLVETGNKVYLVENKSNIGGTLALLNRWYPDNHCNMCQSLFLPTESRGFERCLRQGLFHPDIEILLNSEVVSIEGEYGNFSVTLLHRYKGVRDELCIACGECEKVCPVSYDGGILYGERKAIFRNNPISLLGCYEINKSLCTGCGRCLDACPVHAIDLQMADEVRQLHVSGIILASGFEEFDPSSATAYGHGRYPNVITGLELEQMLSESSPSNGMPVRPSDNRIPDSVAFLQCVGSRTHDKDYCSSVCCMYSLKEAILLKQKRPDINITVYYMDMRDYGKDYHRYFLNARDRYGIKFVRCRIPVVEQDFRTRNLLISSAGDDNHVVTRKYDMVVLAIGQTLSSSFKELCQRLGISINDRGFVDRSEFSPVETEKSGIYICGSLSGPKDIPDTLIESTAAACRAGKLCPAGNQAKNTSSLMSRAQPAIVLCNCNGKLSEILHVADFVKSLPGVAGVFEVNNLCHPEPLQMLRNNLLNWEIEKLVIVACKRVKLQDLNFPSVELINVREQLAWVHRHEGEAAVQKLHSLIKMSLAKLSNRELHPAKTKPFSFRTLVIGGGVAGLNAALAVAEKGVEVILVEKSDHLGGNAKHLYYSTGGGNIPDYLDKLITRVKSRSLISYRLETVPVSIEGYAGNFRCVLKNGAGNMETVQVGTVIVATGAGEWRPSEYCYGQSDNILTLREFEEKLYHGSVHPGSIKSVAMIQCVGSREPFRPYCSRVCCSQALKNALLLKQKNPDINVSIFFRDIMSYGLKERYYTEARERGIMFYRYNLEHKPVVSLEEDKITVVSSDISSGEQIRIDPDFLVLSTAIAPFNADLAGILGVDLSPDGFFQEAETKFRPLDLKKDGIFTCGLARAPADLTESIAQAEAAAQRALAIMSRMEKPPGSYVACVSERRCTACERCVSACPYNARFTDREKGIVRVIESLCRGCGTCVAECPSGASRLIDLDQSRMFSMLDATI